MYMLASIPEIRQYPYWRVIIRNGERNTMWLASKHETASPRND